MISCLKSKITVFLTCLLTFASVFVHADAIKSCDNSAALLADPQRKSEPAPFKKIDVDEKSQYYDLEKSEMWAQKFNLENRVA